MDKAEAIKRIKDHIRVHHIGEYPHIKIAEALDMAISALANDNNVGNKWIPVSERLPGIFQPVIVWTKFKEIGEAHYNGKRFQWIDDEGDYDYAYVTHWMPLPEPPKEE